jgi:hypothetical protein
MKVSRQLDYNALEVYTANVIDARVLQGECKCNAPPETCLKAERCFHDIHVSHSRKAKR